MASFSLWHGLFDLIAIATASAEGAYDCRGRTSTAFNQKDLSQYSSIQKVLN